MAGDTPDRGGAKAHECGNSKERNAMTYLFEVRERAENLYVIEGMTYTRIARLTGVTTRQITTWSREDNWQEKRREYRRAYGEIKRNLVLLRSRLMASALETMDPKMVCAIARLEIAARDRKGDTGFAAGLPDEEDKEPVNTAKEAVATLQEALKRKVDAITAQPERLTPEVIKEIKTSLDLIDLLRKQYRMEEERPGGLSDEAASKIRRMILGCES